MFLNKNDFLLSDDEDDKNQQSTQNNQINNDDLIKLPTNNNDSDEDDFFKQNQSRQQFQQNNVYGRQQNQSEQQQNEFSQQNANNSQYGSKFSYQNNYNQNSSNTNLTKKNQQTIDQLLYMDNDDNEQEQQKQQQFKLDSFTKNQDNFENDQFSRNQFQNMGGSSLNSNYSTKQSGFMPYQESSQYQQNSNFNNNSSQVNNQGSNQAQNIRQQFQMKQRQSFIDKQNLKSQPQASIITANQNYKPQNMIYQSKLNDQDIDEIQRILQPTNNVQQYEPGTNNSKNSNLPQLNKQDYIIKNNEEEDGQSQQKKSQQNNDKQQQQPKQSKTLKNTKTQKLSDSDEQEEEDQKRKQQKNEKQKKQQKQESESEESEEEEEEDDDEEEKKLQEQSNIKNKQHHDVKIEMTNEKSEQEQQQVQNKQNQIRCIDHMEIQDLKKFATNPAPKGYMIQCTIKRDKSGLARFFPVYHMCFSGQSKYVMSAKKKPYNKTSNYTLSINPSDFKKTSNAFVGKLRSNFMGTEFNVYDSGDNPKKATSLDNVRKQLGTIIYESNILGAKGPRKMKILIPEVNEDGTKHEWKPLKGSNGILQSFKQGQIEGIKFLYNKPPKWNEQVQAFVLNFNGRVDKPSVKNFQLIDSKDENRVYLQFGRIGDNTFNIDFQWPITPQQAFSIALSSFDYKFACE